MNFKVSRRLFAACGAILLSGVATLGQAAADTLQKIKDRGQIVIGVQMDNVPWGFIESNGQPNGYDIDLAKELAQHFGVDYKFERVTAANRIAMLNTGKVDLLVAVVGMYPDRAKSVQFSKPYSTIDVILLAEKERDIKSIDDVTALRVGVARGTSLDMTISELLKNSSNIQRYDDDPMAIQALYSGQVDVLGASNMYMITMKNLPNFDRFESKAVLRRQYNGIALRKGDETLRASVNAFIDAKIEDGTLDTLNQKWIGEELPDMPDQIEGVPF